MNVSVWVHCLNSVQNNEVECLYILEYSVMESGVTMYTLYMCILYIYHIHSLLCVCNYLYMCTCIIDA